MLSVAELALIPFELARMPQGVIGAGSPLVLQTRHPTCVTRRVRHAVLGMHWARPVRILMIAAAPSDVGLIPRQEHLDALVRAVNP